MQKLQIVSEVFFPLLLSFLIARVAGLTSMTGKYASCGDGNSAMSKYYTPGEICTVAGSAQHLSVRSEYDSQCTLTMSWPTVF